MRVLGQGKGVIASGTKEARHVIIKDELKQKENQTKEARYELIRDKLKPKATRGRGASLCLVYFSIS